MLKNKLFSQIYWSVGQFFLKAYFFFTWYSFHTTNNFDRLSNYFLGGFICCCFALLYYKSIHFQYTFRFLFFCLLLNRHYFNKLFFSRSMIRKSHDIHFSIFIPKHANVDKLCAACFNTMLKQTFSRKHLIVCFPYWNKCLLHSENMVELWNAFFT